MSVNNTNDLIKQAVEQAKKAQKANKDKPAPLIKPVLEPEAASEPAEVEKPEQAEENLDEAEPLPVEKPKPSINKKSNQRRKEENETDIFNKIKENDNGDGAFMLHVRVNEKLYKLMNQISSTTKISVTKYMSYAISELLKNNPELEETMKKHLKNLEL